MKKILSMILCCLLILSAASCSAQREKPPASDATSDTVASDTQAAGGENTAGNVTGGTTVVPGEGSGGGTDVTGGTTVNPGEGSGEGTDVTGGSSGGTPEQVKQDLSQLDTSAYSGSFGTYITLTDPVTGVPVVDTVLPYGWTAQVQSDWSFVSTANPCIATIQFTSPDKKAAVLLQTSHDYLQSSDTMGWFPHRDYIDRENYIVHLAYKNAGQVLDMYFNGIIGTAGTVVNETPVPDEVQSILDQAAQIYLSAQVNGINQIGGGYGITAQAYACEGTASIRRYRFTGSDGKSYLADALALCVAAEYICPSYGTNYIYIPWIVPSIMIFTAEDEQTLEKYRAQYEMIVNNVLVRNEFNYIKHVYGSYIRNMLMQQMASSIAAMTEAQAQSYMGSYDSSSYTTDDWANDWSDVIYERNEYTTTEGSTIKVSTSVDSVYQNGDEFYFGPKGSAPLGWEQLIPN